MSVLIRMTELRVGTVYLAGETGLSDDAFLHFTFHTVESLRRMSVALDWPDDHIERMLLAKGLPVPTRHERTSRDGTWRP